MAISYETPAAALGTSGDLSIAAATRRVGGPALTAAVAIAVGALALTGGGYALGARNPAAIAVWWTAGLGVTLGLWPRTRLPGPALAAGGALAALAALAAVSATWGTSTEAALEESGRTAAYLGVLVLVVLVARSGSAARWADGIAAGIAGVGLLALATRLFPGLGIEDSAGRFFEGDVYLSFPLGYWNAVAAFIALSFPLLLRAGLDARSGAARVAAMASLPALAGALFLTSSRGGMLTAAIATAVFVALAADRVRAAAAAAVMAAGAAAVVAVLFSRELLMDGPFDTAAAAAEGRSAAVLIALVCAAVAAVWHVIAKLRLRAPRPGRTLGRAMIATVVLAVAASAIAVDPVARLESFSAPPPNPFSQPADPGADLGTGSHLLSGTSSGRWQFWQAATEQFADRPLLGHGAGSYESWWAEHGSIAYFTRQAHSLYLETLGELGLLGLLAIAGLLAAVAIATVRRRRASAGTERTTIAALGAVAAGFAVAAGLDWMWEVPAVAVVGIAAFGLLTGAATAPPAVEARAARAVLPRVAFALTAAVAIALLALPWLAERQVRESRRAALAGATPAAIEAARAAQRLTPWAASPRLQHALALEGSGDLHGAGTEIVAAIERSPADWRLRLVQARIRRADGDADGAAAAMREARRLSPRSMLLQGNAAQ